MTSSSVPENIVVAALGWTLLHFCWQGAAIAVVLWCALSLLHKRSSQSRYLAACAALLLMVAAPVVTFTHLVVVAHDSAGPLLIGMSWIHPEDGRGGISYSEPLSARVIRATESCLPFVVSLWSAGLLFVCGRLALGLLQAHRIKSAPAPPCDERLSATCQRLARRLSITRPIRLLNSAMVEVPTLIGWFRPVILVPFTCLTGLSTDQVEAILVHELAHIRRHDYLVSVLQSVVEALLFYHPSVWWVSKIVRREREHCCDDIAVQVSGDALTYARALSLLEEYRSTPPVFSLGATGGNLVMRIQRLLAPQQRPALPQSSALVVLAFMIAGAAVGVGTMARAQSSSGLQPALPSIPRSASSPSGTSHPEHRKTADGLALAPEYENWLDQDVRWNITPVEQEAFLQLASDPERDHFIEQFWLRRDPTGASPNTFKTEHYGRLAYANQHFAANLPGWETDRGHVFTVYGKPSSIDSHPATLSTEESYEIWTYDNASGIDHKLVLKFVDACKCGDYQLQQSPFGTSNGVTPDRLLYDKGLNDILEGRYETARLALQTLLNRYPASSLTTPAQLAIARSWDEQGGPEASEQANRSYDEAGVAPLPIGNGVMAPIVTYSVEPEYTEAAKKAKVNGAVLLNLWVDEQGATSHVRVVHSVAKDLDDKAIQAVRQYRFKPALRDGRPVLVAVNIEVNFATF